MLNKAEKKANEKSNEIRKSRTICIYQKRKKPKQKNK